MFSAKHYALVGKTLCLDALTRSSNVLPKTFSVILEINVNKVIIIMTSFVSVLAIIGLFYGKSHNSAFRCNHRIHHMLQQFVKKISPAVI